MAVSNDAQMPDLESTLELECDEILQDAKERVEETQTNLAEALEELLKEIIAEGKPPSEQDCNLFCDLLIRLYIATETYESRDDPSVVSMRRCVAKWASNFEEQILNSQAYAKMDEKYRVYFIDGIVMQLEMRKQ